MGIDGTDFGELSDSLRAEDRMINARPLLFTADIFGDQSLSS
ncbi:hypothetical protein MA5S0422_2784 [Mycobacteroides abscessus 5S-0422]|uniref:Uncharacterized protein n=1 Tax=Mycobacteroides abscessus subsp. bolletii 1513 TaxID=1299321 RepID=X8DQ51_9MYCO|nr:hypothetical protein MA5S0304_1850 [Mycobacteroides abscessus 5S-0304]EIU12949.1 hypothetical protein MA5S0421_2102 [Mycobacteroides abscessus 5S-0421]EIU13876.1 hypothetical protein MA5S0422_2784 [Mycobacteroides abscessus 5S-0422]EIU20140.1 hypothetical protein MA5S0708_4870 [Mycobacteroides abscessus 5S-0708]EIU25719.1 hypothetical protein MA5S0817_5181 [Mycobacteroides abscessus 5S-0817]EIU30257.1 hypothetical protein MA5S1212_4568 [Mycobacteroides abscessus 5S-1212]EIU43558.1 hypothet